MRIAVNKFNGRIAWLADKDAPEFDTKTKLNIHSNINRICIGLMKLLLYHVSLFTICP